VSNGALRPTAKGFDLTIRHYSWCQAAPSSEQLQ
jgi:hypothetical protein